MLKKPQVWDNPINANTIVNANTIEASRSGLNLTADSLNSLKCPSTGAPMKVVKLHMFDNNGVTSEPTWVGVNEDSRIVLPLPNEILEAINEQRFNPSQHNLEVQNKTNEALRNQFQWDQSNIRF